MFFVNNFFHMYDACIYKTPHIQYKTIGNTMTHASNSNLQITL